MPRWGLASSNTVNQFDTAFLALSPALYGVMGEPAVYQANLNGAPVGSPVPLTASIGAMPSLRSGTDRGVKVETDAEILVPVSSVPIAPNTGDTITVASGQRAGIWKVDVVKGRNGAQWALGCRRDQVIHPGGRNVRRTQ